MLHRKLWTTSLTAIPRINYIPCSTQRMLLSKGIKAPQADLHHAAMKLYQLFCVQPLQSNATSLCTCRYTTHPHWNCSKPSFQTPEEREMLLYRYRYFPRRHHTKCIIFKTSAQLKVSILRSGKWLLISSGSTYKLVLKTIEKAVAELHTKQLNWGSQPKKSHSILFQNGQDPLDLKRQSHTLMLLIYSNC